MKSLYRKQSTYLQHLDILAPRFAEKIRPARSRSATRRDPAAELECTDREHRNRGQRGLAGTVAAAAADSGLAALYSIKKEPAQEPTAANSRDEQHAAPAKDSDQAAADLGALAERGNTTWSLNFPTEEVHMAQERDMQANTLDKEHRGQRSLVESMAAVVALRNVKKEPGQPEEATAANSRDEQHGAVAKDSDQAVADLAALAVPAGAIAAAAAAQQRASAVPKHVRPVPGTDQTAGDESEVESGEEEDCEPVSKRRKKCVATSAFVGVSWNKKDRKWIARIRHDGKVQYLGSFDDDHEAARAADTAARRLRGDDAHGGRAGKGNWHRLNFPTEAEVKRAQPRGALLTEEDKAAAAAAASEQRGPSAASEQQGPSKFVGVSWFKKNRKWKAKIKHNGKAQYLGTFDDEREAARAVDTAARRLRGEDAHGGRAGGTFLRLNFPTEAEVKRAQERGALLTEEDKAAAAAASEWQTTSKFVGVSWNKRSRKWIATIRHDGKQQHLGNFDDEREAARAFDTAARRLRGEDSHGGRAGGKQWLRLNFPSKREAARAKALGMPAAR